MRKYLLSTVALFSLTAAAGAADLPVRSAPPPYVAAVPIFTWTGFYVGLNAGYGWNANSGRTVFVPDFGLVDVGGNDDGGFVGGAQIGYNWQFGSFVIGAEADIQWADIGGSDSPFLIGNTFVGGGGNSTDWFGTVRARAGFAFDRLLVYATGGYAYAGGGGDNGGCFIGNTFVLDCGGGGDDLNGWTLGGGIEWALPVNWFGSSAVTFGLEGLYVNFDNSSSNSVFGNAANIAFENGHDLEFGIFRAKLNFKF
jgi:outer membrane immunogenic protein